MAPCILCKSSATSEYFRNEKHHFLICEDCTTVFRPPESWVSPSAEKERYLAHHNNVEDTGYKKFVTPLVQAVMERFPPTASGLDFGAGTGPVAAKILTEDGYSISLYDPFFHPDKTVLENQYDFIICCEVIEHFHYPLQEFRLLKRLLKPQGTLFCMTTLWTGNKKNFAGWWYKNDSTHTLFYNPANLKFIQEHTGYTSLLSKGNIIEFT